MELLPRFELGTSSLPKIRGHSQRILTRVNMCPNIPVNLQISKPFLTFYVVLYSVVPACFTPSVGRFVGRPLSLQTLSHRSRQDAVRRNFVGKPSVSRASNRTPRPYHSSYLLDRYLRTHARNSSAPSICRIVSSTEQT